MSVKIIAITGINGNQGGSVASTFLNAPGWTVRGITRSIDSATSKAWSAKGVNMVQADLDKPNELIDAFRGVHAIFCVTNWWQELGVPGNWGKAAQNGEDIRKVCYDVEVQRGKNMINAAATVFGDEEILDHLVLSVLPDTIGQSGGKIKDNYHFDAKWAWVSYLREAHSQLVAKTSLFQPAGFLNNWDGEGQNPFVKKSDGTMAIRLPVRPDAPMPFIHPVNDSGRCVRALIEAETPENLAAMGSTMNWTAICEHLTREFSEQKIKFVFEQITLAEYEAMVPGPAGTELAAMFHWIDEYGYFGHDETYVYPKDLELKKR